MTAPKVRDFTTGERRLDVVIDHSPVYELLLRLFVVTDQERCEEYEIGDAWAEAARERASRTLARDLEALGNSPEVWLALVSLAYEASTRTIDAFTDYVAAADPTKLRAHLLTSAWLDPEERPDEDTVAAAAGGDQVVVAQLSDGVLDALKHDGLRHLLAMEPERTRATLVDVLRRFAAEVFVEADEVTELLARDAAEKKALAATLPAREMVEMATNGLTLEVQPAGGVLLIPSVVIRPWNVISEYGTMRIFCYSVSDELMASDPDAPPQWLVKLYKALGDERRLRILGILAEGDAGLGELAERLELSKPTVHHHLGLLRAAGLVRVTLGRDKEYSLRTDVVPQASRLLEAYLAPTPTATSQEA